MTGHEHDHFDDDPALKPIDRDLRRALPVEPPAGLSGRLYHASVGHLPDRPVLARLGQPRTLPWAMAAAIGLIFFYAAAWLNPYVERIVIGADEVATVQQTIAEPNTELDREIDALDQQIAAFSGELDQPLPRLAVREGTRDADDLASELIELERELGQRTF